MKTPLVSVIMPARNAAGFIAEAARSIFSQTEPDLELLVVDPASTDGTGETVRALGDSRLRLIRSDSPLIAGCARNLALAEARGEFVAFLDADDFAEPRRLALQIAYLRRTPAVSIAGSRVAVMDEKGTPCGENFPPIPPEEIPATLLFQNCLALSSITARKAALQPFHTDFPLAEDYDLWVRLAPNVGFAILPQRLTRYRLHSESASIRRREEMAAAVSAIHAAQADRLGFREAPPIHARLTAWPLDASAGQLAEAEAWLLALHAANERHGVYPRRPFQRVLSGRWFSVCMDSWLLGWPVWGVYHRSPLAAPTFRRRAHLLRRLLPQRLRQR
jgi:glycosyltransferase involved in cell wall biosynthesis